MNVNTYLMNTATHGTMKGACPPWTGSFPSDRVKGTRRVYMKEQKTLNQWRKERGLEIEELAEKAKIAIPSLNNWLHSGVTPRIKACLALATALDVDVSQILWGKQEPQEVPAMPEGRVVQDKRIRVTREQYEIAKKWLEAGRNKTEIAEAIGVSREAVYKAFRRFASEDTPEKPSEGPAHEAAGSEVKTRKPKASQAVS